MEMNKQNFFRQLQKLVRGGEEGMSNVETVPNNSTSDREGPVTNS